MAGSLDEPLMFFISAFITASAVIPECISSVSEFHWDCRGPKLKFLICPVAVSRFWRVFDKVVITSADGLLAGLNIVAKAFSVTGCGMLIVIEIGRWSEKKLAAAISANMSI